MTGLAIIDVARDGIFVFLKVAGPIMLVALVVGLVVSLFQALTQIQEQTLIYVPKIVAVFATLLLMLPFMGDALGSYMARIAARIVSGG
ncbi:flagellar biosynthetic protein FliQ [Methylobacterium sp. Leaf125]|jgi:flagellar biosynthetic protein FliQ|uniref:flagellar biosynthesis protein FliQ n=1 Tax=unclassified Methylobacterium TaxID=2615210 RepID=UPI0006F904A2|nr:MULTISPECIES: flagellar biosynthesis protein FliQ [unclassified Methylobacterium]KQQ44327.1 flagellar biosynthetic protein FliQ [Methylobacterium sp. Leaf125]POR41770.1 flagellar biosynthetic protein FliQ [Methylobacterium sp. V23]